ncbi:MAG: ribonucleoside-diphosphate reductase subunit alpha [Solirubrobacteraceae bacterium]|nr:ribonucleoside-diphosphate reductase subunit alpha [Solirubrobacteraceae bacterium]
MLDFSDLLRDLDLKAAAAVTAPQRPPFDVGPALLAGPSFRDYRDLALKVTGSDGGDAQFRPEIAAEMVADALVTLTIAEGDARADTASARAVVGSITKRVCERLIDRGLHEGRITEHDVSALVEAQLIEAGQFEVAKALVLRRAVVEGVAESAAVLSTTAAAEGTVGVSPRLVRRSGAVVAWDGGKIEAAIRNAFLSLSADSEPAGAITARVTERAQALGKSFVEVETVQDLVQEELMLAGHMRVAERYIIYRAERALLRAQEAAGGQLSLVGDGSPTASTSPAPADDVGLSPVAASSPIPAPEFPPIPVLAADGSEEEWDGRDLVARIAYASTDLDIEATPAELERELRRSVRPGIPRSELRTLAILNARALVERDSEYSAFAGRILLSYAYEEALEWDIVRDGIEGLAAAHRGALEKNLRHGVSIERIDARLLDYDLDRLAAELDPSADLAFDFLGLQTLYDRYLLIDKTDPSNPRRFETPQLFWMRVAMGIGLGEPEGSDREARIIDLYAMYSGRRFCSSTPTLFNAGTPHSQLSSCFLYKVEDTLDSIMQRGIAENAQCSKYAGGLGGSWTAVRGTGSHIGSTNGESQGVVPFLKLHNDQLVAVNQGGKRAGAGCAYLELWHNDIREFLELRKNTGDDRRRTHDMNTANWIPDLFMQRMEARGLWTLFRSSDVPDLHDLYGKAFQERYEHYESLVAAGELHGEQIPAIDLWKAMLKMLFETGHPWITFKDPCNLRSPQDHAGVVHSSNLCTEITLNTGVDETAVCNLGSVVIDQHLDGDGNVDHDKLRATVRVAVRALDNVIDVNFYPTVATRTANERHRPVGLGVMGLQYALYAKGIAFGSPEAVAFSDEMMEAIALYAYEASSDLAAERGTYGSYSGSKWDRGLLPQDTIDLLEAERGETIEVPRGGVLDWGPVRAKIASQGMRNSNVIAIAPTATIANIMGTSPCIEPLYKNLFAKSNLSGDFTMLNPFLVADLKAIGAWNRDLASAIKAHDGDLTEIDAVPTAIRERYRTAFQIDSHWLIDAAAVRQKWIDQSQSLNLFLSAPDMKVMSHMYRHAWRSGLKTTYYLRTLGASSIEKATVGKVAEAAPTPAVAPAMVATSSAPATGLLDPSAPLPSSPSATAVESDLGDVTLSAAEACSIEAMLNGGECESCQ